ncbi:MAG: hypothetical protein IJM97_08785 [Clostridia bacterium]|nr:hypothetical protein [Clostridia bacterium]
MEIYDLPLGFSMALAKNPDAIQKFAVLSEDKKRAIIEGTRNIRSKAEMKAYVNSIITNW